MNPARRNLLLSAPLLLTGCGFALPGFHRVLHQDADFGHLALKLGANLDRLGHAYPPHPPSVTLISRKAT